MARLEQFENMERFPFMALPPELRLMVYDFALEDIKKYTEPRAHLKQRAGSKVPQNPVALLWVSRCIRNEVLYPDTSALDLSVSIHRQKANWTAEFTGKLSYKYLAFAPANPMKRGQSSPRWMGIEDRNAHQLIRLVRYAVFSLKLRQHCFLVVTLTFGDAVDLTVRIDSTCARLNFMNDPYGLFKAEKDDEDAIAKVKARVMERLGYSTVCTQELVKGLAGDLSRLGVHTENGDFITLPPILS
ncbi:hypothetical protein D6D18_03144 [Aureobasidium pullulans]|uniref:Uncharacterized protein n=1 Tax=Aureobasidium pullulans TaxID=5580 RepID=A0A4V4IGF4_AURPU|nr:hypothetical protein D6D21_09487 [Aureobasidium pullulans]THW87320.1 hypothetical protein D6D15_06764 [Aureobasidium pullulans]THX05246.1 hypothetical protein D6D18_03144 [Aureobasidium pullulans]